MEHSKNDDFLLFKRSTSLSSQSSYQPPNYTYALKLTGLITASVLGMGLLVTGCYLPFIPLIAIGAVMTLTGVVAANHFVLNYKEPNLDDPEPDDVTGMGFN